MHTSYPFYWFFGAILKQKLIKKTGPRVDILSWYFARRAMSNTKTQTHVRKSALNQRGWGQWHGMSTKDHHLHETCGNSHMARWTHEAPRARLFPLHPRSVFLTRHGNDAEATLEEKRWENQAFPLTRRPLARLSEFESGTAGRRFEDGKARRVKFLEPRRRLLWNNAGWRRRRRNGGSFVEKERISQ